MAHWRRPSVAKIVEICKALKTAITFEEYWSVFYLVTGISFCLLRSLKSWFVSAGKEQVRVWWVSSPPPGEREKYRSSLGLQHPPTHTHSAALAAPTAVGLQVARRESL